MAQGDGIQLQRAGLPSVSVQLRVPGEAIAGARKGPVFARLLFHFRGRSDDNLEVIKRRFYSYEHETAEVLKCLREKVGVAILCEIVPCGGDLHGASV